MGASAGRDLGVRGHSGGDPMTDYELIDTTDNDCHDTGSREEMLREAGVRNSAESRSCPPCHGSGQLGYVGCFPCKVCNGSGRWQRFVVRPEGWSAEHFEVRGERA